MTAGFLPLVLLALAPDPAQEAARAEVAVAEAVALHAAGKLEEASAALEHAYSIYPDRDYLYMRGVIEREAGRCDEAEPLFDAFIAENPPLVDIRAAQDQLEKCAATLPKSAPPTEASVPPPGPVLEPPVAASDPSPRVVVADRAAPAPRSWRNDRIGHALVGSGLAVALVGGGLLGGATQRASAADRADTAGDYRGGIAAARSLNVAGFAAVGVATSLVISGVVHYVVFGRRAR